MINHAMFQRNGRAGYVLKPEVIRNTEDPRKSDKEHFYHHTQHYLEVTVSLHSPPGFRSSDVWMPWCYFRFPLALTGHFGSAVTPPKGRNGP